MCSCVVTTMENDMRASEMTKAIFRVWQPQAHLERKGSERGSTQREEKAERREAGKSKISYIKIE